MTCVVCVFAEGVSTVSGLGDSQNAATMSDLQRRLQEMEDTHLCNICMERPLDVAFLCGHRACQECAKPLTMCHMCRKPINHKINLY